MPVPGLKHGADAEGDHGDLAVVFDRQGVDPGGLSHQAGNRQRDRGQAEVLRHVRDEQAWRQRAGLAIQGWCGACHARAGFRLPRNRLQTAV